MRAALITMPAKCRLKISRSRNIFFRKKVQFQLCFTKFEDLRPMFTACRMN